MANRTIGEYVRPRIVSVDQLVQCAPARIEWAGGLPPYTVRTHFLNTNSPSKIILYKENRTAFGWLCDAAAGRNITVEVTDATLKRAVSASQIVGAGFSNCTVRNVLSGTPKSVTRSVSASATSMSASSNGGHGPSQGTVAGTVIAVIGALAVVGALLICSFRKHRAYSARSAAAMEEAGTQPVTATVAVVAPPPPRYETEPAPPYSPRSCASSGVSGTSALLPERAGPDTAADQPPGADSSTAAPAEPADTHPNRTSLGERDISSVPILDYASAVDASHALRTDTASTGPPDYKDHGK